MVGVIECEIVRRAVRNVLAADSVINTDLAVGGRIYLDEAPERVVFPVITIALMSAVDLLTVDARHVWQDVDFLVKVTEQFTGVTINYGAKLVPIATRIHEVLDGLTMEVNNVHIVKVRRSSMPPQPPSLVGGARYAYVNQIFRTEAHPI